MTVAAKRCLCHLSQGEGNASIRLFVYNDVRLNSGPKFLPESFVINSSNIEFRHTCLDCVREFSAVVVSGFPNEAPGDGKHPIAKLVY